MVMFIRCLFEINAQSSNVEQSEDEIVVIIVKIRYVFFETFVLKPIGSFEFVKKVKLVIDVFIFYKLSIFNCSVRKLEK